MAVNVQGSLRKYDDKAGFLAFPWHGRKIYLLSPAAHQFTKRVSIPRLLLPLTAANSREN